MRNLKYQMKNAIDQNFRERMDKDSIKNEKQMDDTRIFSWSDRNNLIDLSANFANFMQTNHNEIREMKNVTTEHVQNFLNERSKTCTSETLKQYASKFNKIERLINKTYSTANVNFHTEKMVTFGNERTRDIAMTREHYSQLMNHVQGSRSQGVLALDLAGRFGLRVSEIPNIKGMDIRTAGDAIVLHIHESKGNRSRDLDVTKPEDRDFLINRKQECGDNQRLVSIKEDSINKFLQRNLNELHLTVYQERDTGVHAIRKMVAQERYDEERAKGHTQQEALDTVSNFLGHGNNRNDLMKKYVLEM